ncbi:GM21233, partial [Drosophila sechellia]
DRIEQEQQLELERELERQRECDLKAQQEQASEAAIAASEDEGQIVETIDTTTIITSSSNTSICMTTLMRKDSPRQLEQPPQMHMMAPNHGNFCNPGIVIFSGVNESKSKCGIQQDTPEELMIHNRGVGMNMGGQNGCKADAFCGVGDGVNIGIRMEMVE